MCFNHIKALIPAARYLAIGVLIICSFPKKYVGIGSVISTIFSSG
jgi:hypothetical protein